MCGFLWEINNRLICSRTDGPWKKIPRPKIIATFYTAQILSQSGRKKNPRRNSRSPSTRRECVKEKFTKKSTTESTTVSHAVSGVTKNPRKNPRWDSAKNSRLDSRMKELIHRFGIWVNRCQTDAWMMRDCAKSIHQGYQNETKLKPSGVS